MRIEEIQKCLDRLAATSADIEGLALVNQEGFIIACVLPASLDEERVASIIAAFQGLADRCSEMLEKGRSLQTLLKTERGYVVITRVGSDAYLSLISGPRGKPGMLLVDARQTTEEILSLL
jgi:uncharacterized protein